MQFKSMRFWYICYWLFSSLLFLLPIPLLAQKQYQGLLWQISGNGLTKPSYLYGTMHVSEKVAFHLSDSFYLAINSVEVVSLETNPEILMEDLMESDYFNPMLRSYVVAGRANAFDREAFIFAKNNKILIKRALAEDLDLINGLLFRNNKHAENYQENTYLDLYIYKTGKKLKKQITGVERFQDVMRLSKEASKMRDNDYYSRKRLSNSEVERIMSDAYRRGDLDMLDSLHQIESPRGYLEKMLYERNITMSKNIDSIIRKNPLFAAVGAAHLPGEKGIIHLLRSKGYKVRSVKVGTRETNQKETVDKKKYQLVYRTQSSADGFFQIDVPGKLYEIPPKEDTQYYLYPELVNGAFYSVSRIKTYSHLLDKSPTAMLSSIDSLLYENIPGEIVSKKSINKNGYQGFDILNKTRAGNYQRYQIFVTPFEVLVFKLGGTEAFAKGKDGEIFFNSIKMKDLSSTNKIQFKPKHGEFEVSFPHFPIHNHNLTLADISAEDRQDYQTEDTEGYYLMARVCFQHHEYIEEDSFELRQVAESFAETNDYKILSTQFDEKNAYRSLDIQYETPAKQSLFVRVWIRGFYYYLLVMKPKSPSNPSIFTKNPFFSQFRLLPIQTDPPKLYVDKSLHFQVQTSSQPLRPLENENAWIYGSSEKEKLFKPRQETVLFYHIESGEKISVEFYQYNHYASEKDSSRFWEKTLKELHHNGNFTVRSQQFQTFPDYVALTLVLGDTGTQRLVHHKFIQKGAVTFLVSANSDGEPSDFVKTFLQSFAPTDTILGRSIFRDASSIFLQNLMSKDTTIKAATVNLLKTVSLKSADRNELRRVIEQFRLPEESTSTQKIFQQNYIQVKSQLLETFVSTTKPEEMADIRQLYFQVSDTVEMQLAILQGLAAQKTTKSYALLKELLFAETPLPSGDRSLFDLFDTLSDSLALSYTLYPELFSLTTMDEYKEYVYELLVNFADSGFLKPEVYQNHESTILNEARIALKRKTADEQQGRVHNNNSLTQYAILLLPYYQNPTVRTFFDKVMRLKRQTMKMDICIEMLKQGISVPDSIWEDLAKNDMYRVRLYSRLKKAKKLQVFPAAYLSQKHIAKSIFVNEFSDWSYKNIDTLWQVECKEYYFKGKKGNLYIYKYRLKDAPDWHLGMTGLQPSDTTQWETEGFRLNEENYLLEEDKPEQVQMAKMIKETSLKARNRRVRYQEEEEDE
ncbi:MAG: TraB/GumN family protein [Bacteroidia bacterium]